MRRSLLLSLALVPAVLLAACGAPNASTPPLSPAAAVTSAAPETTAPETTAPETTAPETTAPETTAAPHTVALSPKVLALLERVNGWCRGTGDECRVHENPASFPNRVPSGETNGLISNVQESLGAHGHALEWNGTGYSLQVDQDTQRVVGNFSPDHFGPEAFAAITARVRANPAAHLDALERTVQRIPDDPMLAAQFLASWYPTTLLKLCQDENERVARTAARLRVRYETLLAHPSHWQIARDPQRRERLTKRRDALRGFEP